MKTFTFNREAFAEGVEDVLTLRLLRQFVMSLLQGKRARRVKPR